MSRITNHVDAVVDDMLQGVLVAHPELTLVSSNARVVKSRRAGESGRVGIVTGGGSGHEPAFIGYVGQSLVDAVAIGEVFSSPSAKTFLDAFSAADGGAGVACLYGNYAGDNMNVRIAIKSAEKAGIKVRTVVANDDAASAPSDDRGKRRGVAGEIIMWKIAAARAARGGSLDEVIDAAQRAIDNTRSMGIGLSPCTIPAVGKPNFTIAEGSMEVGIGHHGEPGTGVQKALDARPLSKLMIGSLLSDLPFTRGDRVSVLLSGLGATSLMEQYILYGNVFEELTAAGLLIDHSFVGNMFTSLDMKGVSVTLTRLDDDLADLLAHPCSSIALKVESAQ